MRNEIIKDLEGLTIKFGTKVKNVKNNVTDEIYLFFDNGKIFSIEGKNLKLYFPIGDEKVIEGYNKELIEDEKELEWRMDLLKS